MALQLQRLMLIEVASDGTWSDLVSVVGCSERVSGSCGSQISDLSEPRGTAEDQIRAPDFGERA